MIATINGKDYSLVRNVMTDTDRRASYVRLAKTVFGLDFSPWIHSGYCGESFLPYTLYDGETAVSSVAIVISNFKWEHSTKKYGQISTVMTHPDYRGRGLIHALMELVLAEWRHKCDMIYLYANDSVVDFYPKYGFETAAEYRYSKSLAKKAGPYRKLDLQKPEDTALLTEKYRNCNNPFSALQMDRNLSMLMFHCVTFLQDNIFYIEEYDAVVIAAYEDDTIFCYDVFTDRDCEFADVIQTLAADTTNSVVLGFTPKEVHTFSMEKSTEDNTTVFVLKTGENIFARYKVTFPFLSRA